MKGREFAASIHGVARRQLAGLSKMRVYTRCRGYICAAEAVHVRKRIVRIACSEEGANFTQPPLAGRAVDGGHGVCGHRGAAAGRRQILLLFSFLSVLLLLLLHNVSINIHNVSINISSAALHPRHLHAPAPRRLAAAGRHQV